MNNKCKFCGTPFSEDRDSAGWQYCDCIDAKYTRLRTAAKALFFMLSPTGHYTITRADQSPMHINDLEVINEAVQAIQTALEEK